MTKKEQKQREIIEIVQPYIEYMQTAKTWKIFRMENPHLKLPSASSISKYFEGWSNIKKQLGLLPYTSESWDKDALKKVLLPYREHLHTMSSWKSFKNNNPTIRLPNGNTLLKVFGKWDNLRKFMGITKITWVNMSKDEVLKILLPHKPYLITSTLWREYYKQHPDLKLPSGRTLLVIFESWDKVLRLLGFDESSIKTPKEYTIRCRTWNSLKPSEYLRIVLPHIEYLTTFRACNQYVLENKNYNLPSSQVIIKYFSTWNKAKDFFNSNKMIDLHR